MLKTKTMFFIVTIISTIIVMSSNSWISMWMGMEMNMMAFIPLIKKNSSKNSSDAIIIYFLIQSISSSIMLFSIIMNTLYLQMKETAMTMMFLSLMMKMGAAPFHLWIPEMMSKMEWSSCIMLMTWQKMAPLTVSSNINVKGWIPLMIITLSVVLGSMGGLNQTSLKKIMGYSSINHIGWIMSLNKIQSNWIMYMLIYSMMIATTCNLFKKYNMLFINQVNSMNLSPTEKLSFISSMLSLGGMPPMIGFLPKWMAIQTMMNDNLFFIMMLMIMFSLITLFFYMRIMSPMIMLQSMINKWVVTKFNKNIIMLTLMLNFSLPLVTIMNFL